MSNTNDFKNPNSDKKRVLYLISICAAVVLIFSFAWAKQFFHNLNTWWYSLIEGGLITGFVIESIGAYRYSEDPNKEWKRAIVVLFTIALIGWAAGWSAGSNEKKMMNDDINQAKQQNI